MAIPSCCVGCGTDASAGLDLPGSCAARAHLSSWTISSRIGADVTLAHTPTPHGFSPWER